MSKKKTETIVFTVDEFKTIVSILLGATPFLRPIGSDYAPIENLRKAEKMLVEKLQRSL